MDVDTRARDGEVLLLGVRGPREVAHAAEHRLRLRHLLRRRHPTRALVRFVVVRCGRRRPRVLDGDVRGAANGRAPRAGADERRLVLIARVRLFGDLGPHLQIAEEIVGVGVGLGARRGIVGESLGAQRGHPRLDHRGRLREPFLSAGFGDLESRGAVSTRVLGGRID